jgi:hypothetical protein
LSRAPAATPALLVKADRSSYLNPFSDEGDTCLKPERAAERPRRHSDSERRNEGSKRSASAMGVVIPDCLDPLR